MYKGFDLSPSCSIVLGILQDEQRRKGFSKGQQAAEANIRRETRSFNKTADTEQVEINLDVSSQRPHLWSCGLSGPVAFFKNNLGEHEFAPDPGQEKLTAQSLT